MSWAPAAYGCCTIGFPNKYICISINVNIDVSTYIYIYICMYTQIYKEINELFSKPLYKWYGGIDFSTPASLFRCQKQTGSHSNRNWLDSLNA